MPHSVSTTDSQLFPVGSALSSSRSLSPGSQSSRCHLFQSRSSPRFPGTSPPSGTFGCPTETNICDLCWSSQDMSHVSPSSLFCYQIDILLPRSFQNSIISYTLLPLYTQNAPKAAHLENPEHPYILRGKRLSLGF